MHLLVLSAFRLEALAAALKEHIELFQCTFWCSVLSDNLGKGRPALRAAGLNAPSGAQCFPTRNGGSVDASSIGSQCTFWCSVLSDLRRNFRHDVNSLSQCTFWCSVLSDVVGAWSEVVFQWLSQCTFWCSVLSDKIEGSAQSAVKKSQCTFWCSVLSDFVCLCR